MILAGQRAGHVLELDGVGVERDDMRAAAGGFERVASGAAAQVEEAVAGAHPEPVVVDGQQLRPVAASTLRYSSAVRSAVARHV